jgi:hypothetical protein
MSATVLVPHGAGRGAMDEPTVLLVPKCFECPWMSAHCVVSATGTISYMDELPPVAFQVPTVEVAHGGALCCEYPTVRMVPMDECLVLWSATVPGFPWLVPTVLGAHSARCAHGWCHCVVSAHGAVVPMDECHIC